MTPVSVTLPVFVTVNVYGTTWPAAVTDAVVDDLTTSIAGASAIGMFSVSVSGADSVGVRRDRVRAQVGPVAASTSACVTVWLHVYTHVSVGCNLRVGVRVTASDQHRRRRRTSDRSP